MPDFFNDWVVADGVVRVVLFRVLPGYEIKVGRFIEKQVLKIGLRTKNFRVIRLFGSYDIACIHDGASIALSDFTRLGTIPYVTGSSEYVCYKWKPRRSKRTTFSLYSLGDPLTALCFVKINPLVVQKYGIRPEIAFAGYVRKALPSIQMLGTLGWFEVLLLIPGSSLGQMLDVIGDELPNLIYGYQPEQLPGKLFFTEKTLTLLGHSLDVSDPPKKTPANLVPLFETPLKKEDLSVHLSLSCKPQAMARLEQQAREHFGIKTHKTSIDTRFRFGPRDLDFAIPLDNVNSLDSLLNKLDSFRSSNKGFLIKTHTDIQYKKRWHSTVADSNRRADKCILRFSITPNQAKRLVAAGPEGAAVASVLYRYNNLLEAQTVTDAFTDLLRYVKVTRDFTLGFRQDLTVSARHQIVAKVKALKDAIDQRTQGVYAGVEESPFALGFKGMGLAKVFKALEYYVTVLLRRLSKEWNGFVICGEFSRFEHVDQVIIVPSEYSLSARHHWAITHETMHVLQRISPRTLSAKSIFPEDRGSTVSRYRVIGSAHWQLLHEVAADLLDYALCCHLDTDQYLKIVWNYLSGEVFEQHDQHQLRAYLFRSFAIVCYASRRHARSPKTYQFAPEVIKGVLLKARPLFERHPPLKKLFAKNRRGETGYGLLVQEFVADVGPALPHLFKRLDEVQREAKGREARRKGVAKAVGRLKSGGLLPEDLLRNPEAVAWQLACSEVGKDSDKANIAWLLSLWHYHNVNRLGFDLMQLA